MSDIFEIVKENDFKRLKDNLKYVNINAKDENSFSLLHYAVLNNNLEMVRYLLLNNIDVNSQNNDLNSALHLSVIYNYLGIFKTLIKHNALIDLKNKDGETPLMLSIKLKRDEMSNILLSYNAKIDVKNNRDENIVFFASHAGNLKLVLDSIENNKDLLYSKNMNNDTLLHISAKLDNYELTKLLLEKGLEPNILNKDNETPLFNAARENNIEIASLLINNGALIEFKNKFGETIYDYGNNRFNDFIEFKSNSVKYVNFKKKYPLIYAIILNDFDLFNKYLNNVEINKKDDLNLKPIDWAYKYNRQKFIKILLNKK